MSAELRNLLKQLKNQIDKDDDGKITLEELKKIDWKQIGKIALQIVIQCIVTVVPILTVLFVK